MEGKNSFSVSRIPRRRRHARFHLTATQHSLPGALLDSVIASFKSYPLAWRFSVWTGIVVRQRGWWRSPRTARRRWLLILRCAVPSWLRTWDRAVQWLRSWAVPPPTPWTEQQEQTKRRMAGYMPRVPPAGNLGELARATTGGPPQRRPLSTAPPVPFAPASSSIPSTGRMVADSRPGSPHACGQSGWRRPGSFVDHQFEQRTGHPSLPSPTRLPAVRSPTAALGRSSIPLG